VNRSPVLQASRKKIHKHHHQLKLIINCLLSGENSRHEAAEEIWPQDVPKRGLFRQFVIFQILFASISLL